MAKTKSKRRAIAKKSHWSERSVDDFAHQISFDFVTQIDNEIDRAKSSQAELARKVGVTKGRVSQILNSPNTISLKNAVKYARAVDRKVALVLYDDNDHKNANGPVNSEIFSQCWTLAGKPTDFFQLANVMGWSANNSSFESLPIASSISYGAQINTGRTAPLSMPVHEGSFESTVFFLTTR